MKKGDAEEKEAKDKGEKEREKVEKEVDLVTGANGKLGKELVKSLLKKGDVVRALVKSKEFIVDLPPGVVPYIGDITHQKVLDDACNGVDNVYHLAAAVSEYRYTTEELIHINVEGTEMCLMRLRSAVQNTLSSQALLMCMEEREGRCLLKNRH